MSEAEAASISEQDAQPPVDPMIQDNDAPLLSVPLPVEYEDLSQVDLQLAITILEQVELPPFCVHWPTDFQFLVHHFKPDELFRPSINFILSQDPMHNKAPRILPGYIHSGWQMNSESHLCMVHQ